MYILLNWKKYRSYENMKEFVEFTDKLENNINFKFIDLPNIESIKNYIQENKKSNIKIIFPITGRMHNPNFVCEANIEMINILTWYYNSNINLKLYFIPCDPWMYNVNRELFKTLYKFQNKNIKVIYQFLDDHDYVRNKLKLLDSKDLTKVIGKVHPMKIRENVLFCIGNYAYKKSFIPFNKNPINKISISGVLKYNKSNNKPCYFQRNKYIKILKNYPDIFERIKANGRQRLPKYDGDSNNDFNITLNKYIGNIYTTIFDFSSSLVLLKFFEILASGSLLIVSNKEKKICRKLGMKKKIHFLTLDNDDEITIIKEIKSILNPKNRSKIDKIRKNGQLFCQKNLNVDFMYNIFINVIKD
jgi:hypothetical protein